MQNKFTLKVIISWANSESWPINFTITGDNEKYGAKDFVVDWTKVRCDHVNPSKLGQP